MISNDKPSGNRGLHRIRVRASGAPAPDWDALQVLLAFAYTIQQEELRIIPQRRTDVPLRAAQLLPAPPLAHGDIESVLHRVAASVQNLTGASGAAIALGRTDSMICIARSGSHAPEVGSYLDATRGLAGECARSGEPRICVNTATDTRVDPVSARKLGIGSMVYYPLRWCSELMGLLGVFSERAYQFQYRDVRALRFAEALVIDALNQNPEDIDFALSYAPSAPAVAKSAFAQVPQTLRPPDREVAPVLELPPNAAPPITSGVFINKPVAGTLEDGRSPLESLARVEMPEPAEKTPSAPELATAAASPILEHAEENLSDAEARANWKEELDDISCVLRHAHTVGEDEPASAPVPYWTPKPLPNTGERQLGGLAFLLSALVAVMFAGAWMWRFPMVDWLQSHVAVHAKKAPVNASTKTEAEAAKPDDAAPKPAQTAAALNPEELTAKDSRQLLEHVHYWAGPGYSRMTIQLEKSIKYASNRVHDPERVYFDLDTQLLDVREKQFAVDDSLIRTIRIGEFKPGKTRIVFDLKVAGSYTASLADNPPRLIIEFFQKESHSRNMPTPAPAPATWPAQEVAQSQASPNVLTQTFSDPAAHPGRIKIVVDPGHGGHDTGSVSGAGLMEKDLTLDVAQKLGHLLEKELGAEVIYTRTDDRFVPLDSRVATANDAHADFFISIHANSSQYKTVNGIETFYFNSSSEAMESVKVSPLPTGASPANSSNKAAARRFAADVQKSLLRALSRKGNPIRDRGVKTAPFVVLRDAQMPAVLAEIAFMTSKTDAANLMTDGYREKIAEALYTGIANNVQRTRTLAKAGPSGAQAGMN